MEGELRETHFEALIIGTGLTQSIVAGALAAASYPVIHIDEQEFYGGPHASLSLSDLAAHHLTPSTPINPDFLSKSRQYALSLAPHLVPATGPFVAALVNSGVARYGSFVLPKRVAVVGGEGRFKSVPSSKQDVFRDRGVSLVQKRRLIKVLMFASGEFEGSSELNGHEQTPLLQFLSDKFGLDNALAEALAYAVAFCISPNDPTLPALIRTRSYLRATGRYGPSPFLIGHYGGAGELAQGFCRTCAVRGGTYVLGRKVLSITRDEKGQDGGEGEARETSETTHRARTTASGAGVSSYHPPSTFEGYGVEGVDVPPEPTGAGDPSTSTEPTLTKTSPVFRVQLEGFAAPFTANTLVGPNDWIERVMNQTEKEPKFTNTVRGILVVDSPRTFALDGGPATSAEDDQDNDGSASGGNEPRLDETLLVFPPSCGLGSEGSVTVLVNGPATMSCPDGKCILYITAQTSSPEVSPKQHLTPYVGAVLDACTPRPSVHLELYYREKEDSRVVAQKADVSQSPGNLPECEYTSMHLTEGADAAAREAERIFWEVVGEDKRVVEGEEGGIEFYARVAGEDEGLDDF